MSWEHVGRSPLRWRHHCRSDTAGERIFTRKHLDDFRGCFGCGEYPPGYTPRHQYYFDDDDAFLNATAKGAW